MSLSLLTKITNCDLHRSVSIGLQAERTMGTHYAMCRHADGRLIPLFKPCADPLRIFTTPNKPSFTWPMP